MLIVTAVLFLSPFPSRASIECYQCHGTQTPVDYRPLDSSTRNAATGGFQGNHRTHMGNTASPYTCNKCHPGSGTRTSAHVSGVIKISTSMNGSPLPTTYKNTTSAWPQTSVPLLNDTARCANVNCHFEMITPVWGSAPLTSPAGCNVCHGAPPNGTAPSYVGGAAGSHKRHDRYFPGPNNCGRCHPDHAIEPAAFAHATSIGNRALVVWPHDLADSGSGYYSAASPGRYLPSQVTTSSYGRCYNTYCHSDGTSSATGSVSANISEPWGSGSLACSGCHGSPPAYENGSPKANTHSKHNYSCNTCHAATTVDGATIADYSLHVNGAYEVAPGAGVSFTYVYAPTGGTCSDISCHNYATAAWGASLNLTCSSCHPAPPQ